MFDVAAAVVFVAGLYGYQAWMAWRRRHERTLPPIFPMMVWMVAVGAVIGDWWAIALALAGLPPAILLNRRRSPLRVHEAAIALAFEAALIAVGCALRDAL